MMSRSYRSPSTSRGRLFSFLIVLSLLMAVPAISLAAKAGEVTYTKGRVDVKKPGVFRAVPLRKGDSIEVGDIIRTKSNSKAEITYIDGSKINMAERTRLQVKEFKYQPKRSFRSSIFKTFRGMIRVFAAKFEARKGSRFEVESPSAVAGIKGTSWTQTPDYIAVHSGEVEARSINPNFPEKVIVPAGMMVYTPKGAPVSAPTPISDTALQNILKKTERENGDDQGGDESSDDTGSTDEGTSSDGTTEGDAAGDGTAGGDSTTGDAGSGDVAGDPSIMEPDPVMAEAEITETFGTPDPTIDPTTDPSGGTGEDTPTEEIIDIGEYLDPSGNALNPDGSSKASGATTMESEDNSTPPEVATVPITVTAPELLGTVDANVTVEFPARPQP